ncbi:hypothetical protein [Herminiimonas sp. CN]|uniref:hypothetical protein n=1 Tax=Herminiimonas sp. CN TaxID=1349818 RepID=UPI0012DD3855|nr:hypothetical protein [Herminiimonas sp. CN]
MNATAKKTISLDIASNPLVAAGLDERGKAETDARCGAIERCQHASGHPEICNMTGIFTIRNKYMRQIA